MSKLYVAIVIAAFATLGLAGCQETPAQKEAIQANKDCAKNPEKEECKQKKAGGGD